MKKFIPVFAALCALFASVRCFPLIAPVVALTSCSAPSTRVVQVQTLKIVGQSAEAAVTLSAQLYQQGIITPSQARQVMDIFDKQFQPAYRFAVTAAQSNLESVASPELAGLAAQLVQLVATFKPKSP